MARSGITRHTTSLFSAIRSLASRSRSTPWRPSVRHQVGSLRPASVPVAVSQTIDTSFAGSLNPNSVGGVPAMLVTTGEMTMPVGMGMAYAPAFINYANYCPAR